MSLRVTVIENCEQLAAIKPEWDVLAGGHPFLGWDWCEIWWRTYGGSQCRLFVLAVRDDVGTLVGLAPWYLAHHLATGNTVKFIGSNEVCGDRLTILAAAENTAAVTDSVANWLASDARDEWDLIDLSGVTQHDIATEKLCEKLAERDHASHLRPDQLHCWHIPLPTDWEKYLASISKARRMKTRKLMKRAFDAGKAQQRWVESSDDFERGFNMLVELHQKRRNSIGDAGCFTSDKYHTFHHQFAGRMLDQNRLRLAWTEIHGRLAAVEYNFLGHQTIYNYQSGFEPDLAEEHPGWLNMVGTLKWAIESGYTTFDMLRGDEPYKASFGGEPTPLVQVRIVGHKASARLRHAAWRTQATVKRWAKEGLRFATDLRKSAMTSSTNCELTETATTNE